MASLSDHRIQSLFLDALRESCNVTVACMAVGISNTHAYHARKDDPLFADRWAEALSAGVDLLEHEAHRRAFRGVREDVVFASGPSYLYETDENGNTVYVTDPGTGAKLPKHQLDANGHPKVRQKITYSDGLTSLLLKAHRPEKYRDNTALELTGKNGGPVELSQHERASKLGRLLAMARLRKQATDDGIV